MEAASPPLAPETEPHNACALTGVSKAFGAVTAVDDVSLDVAPGSLTCLIGPNGAGKSTLLGCISGFHLVDSGVVRIDGRDVTRWPPHRRARHGLATVFQTTRPLAELDVLDNAAVGAHTRSRTGFVENMLRPPWQRREQQRVRQEAREALTVIGLAWFALAQRRPDRPYTVLPPGAPEAAGAAEASPDEATVDKATTDEPAAGAATAGEDAAGETGVTATRSDD